MLLRWADARWRRADGQVSWLSSACRGHLRMNLPEPKMTTRIKLLPVLLLMIGTLFDMRAAEPDAAAPAIDKSQFHLFNPTPSKYLREMSTDRPDKTESAYTVDAGHFQFEMDLVTYARDEERSGGTTTKVDAWAVAPINLKVGLCNRVDLQLVLETYVDVRVRSGGVTRTMRGYGDTTVRLKYNLWGNDGGPTAMAAMSYVKLPTNQDDLGNDSVEGGLILPLAASLPGGFGMGLMTQFDAVRDSDDRGYHAEFINTITLGHDIVGKLGGYVEFFSAVSAERGSSWIGTLDFGLTYGFTDNIQLDAGVNIGVTKSAADVNPFVGLSWRF